MGSRPSSQQWIAKINLRVHEARIDNRTAVANGMSPLGWEHFFGQKPFESAGCAVRLPPTCVGELVGGVAVHAAIRDRNIVGITLQSSDARARQIARF